MVLKWSLTTLLAPLIFAQTSAQALSNFSSQCLSFDPTSHVPNSTLNILSYVSSPSTLTFENPPPSCNTLSQNVSVPLCRIALNITTSSTSSVISEYWLPANWTGRFLTTGNGGIDGCIKYTDMEYGVSNGFAVAGSNNGHNGTGGQAFYHNDEVLTDYVYRSLHTITSAGKILANAFYSTPFTHSYYLGCSGGGRQGLHAAQVYPSDYDGIVIGAPASNFNNMTSWRASFFSITGAANSTNFISPEIWQGLIHDEVLRQCDGIDGVEDGIIEDPSLCHFRPETLECGKEGIGDCLTAEQVQTVKGVFSPLIGASGEEVFPAMQPGSEILASAGLYDGSPWPYSLDWFRYVVFSSPTFLLPSSLPFNTSLSTAAQALNPFDVQTFPSNLTSFSSLPNHKLLIYHGLQDNQITSFSTHRLYHHLSLSHSPSPSSSSPFSPAPLDSFLRYFPISGMFHCSTGPGAWMIGQSQAGNTGWNAESNILAALVAWVENDIAPETIEGTKWVNDDEDEGVLRQRKHCRLPWRNVYVGAKGGNGTEAGSWKCVLGRDGA